MGRTEARTVLFDDYDGQHEYYCTQHPGTGAIVLFNRVFRVAAPLLGELGKIFGQEGTQNPLDLDINALDWSKLAAFDGGAFAKALDLMSELIAEHFTPEMYAQILKYTSRAMDDASSRTPGEKGKYEKLSAPGVFDRAYQGNLGELVSATIWVLKVNFSPLFIARLRRSGLPPEIFQGLWSKISSQLSKASTQTLGSGTSLQAVTPA